MPTSLEIIEAIKRMHKKRIQKGIDVEKIYKHLSHLEYTWRNSQEIKKCITSLKKSIEDQQSTSTTKEK